MSGAVAPLAVQAVAVAATYIAAALAGFELAFVAEQVSTVWAPTGIAIAALLLLGRRLWPAIWVGAFVANASSDAPLWTAACIAAGNTLEAVAAAWALSRVPRFTPTLARVADVVAFLLIAAVGCTVISATIGVAVLCAAGVQPWDRFAPLWGNWWFGDALGAVIVAPAVLTSVGQRWTRGSALRVCVFVTLALTTTHAAFGVLPLSPHPLEYVIFPVIIAAAVSGGPAVTALTVLAAAAAAIWHTARGAGPFASPDVHTSLILLQIYMGVLGSTALLLAAAVAERLASEQRVREANRQQARRVAEQQTLLDVLPVGIGIATDRECRQIRTNRAFAETLGLQVDINASKTAPAGERPINFRVIGADGLEIPDHELPLQVAAREGREVRDLELEVVHDDGRVVRLLEYAAPLLDEHGIPSGAVGAFVDVTSVHQTRATLTRSEARYRRIFETAAVSLWEEDFGAIKAEIDQLRVSGVDDVEQYIRTHPEFVAKCVDLLRIIDVNQATVRLFGAASKEALKQSLHRIVRAGSLEVFGRLLQALVRGERHQEMEAELQTLGGRRLDVLVSVALPEAGEPLDTVLVSLADITDRKQVENALRQEMDVRTTLARVGESLAGELRSEQLIQAVTDASTKLTEAEFGIFGSTYRGEGIIRLDDVTKDARDGQNATYHGMPSGDVPVRSYLAVPVIGRRGDVLGGLFFGHSQPGVFTERHQQLAAGVAGWAAIALDNARLYQDAEEANRLKDEFLATLSHELRTPLNAVLGWAYMLRQRTMQPALQQRALESLERNARAQVQLVEDLLDVSRIMAGKLRVKSDAVDLSMVVTNAVDTVRAGVAAKGLGLNVHLPAERRLLVTGDADRLQQVVWNLVSNAVKFTPAGGRVDVDVRTVDEKAQIVVRDTGQGIDPSFRPLLFQRFRQMDASKTRVHGGLGLGLSIVRHLVEAHGGTVAVESDGAGRGATFRVVLPLRATEVDEPSRAEAAVAERPLRGLRALVVDDESDARELTRYVLEVRGASVVTSGSAGEALHLLAENAFDILVADIGMPEQDGLSLIRTVRSLSAQAPNRAIPAIAVTAYAGVRERDEALAAGFTAHLGKPVNPDQLTLAISACMTRRPQSHD